MGVSAHIAGRRPPAGPATPHARPHPLPLPHLRVLEAEAVHFFREVAAEFERPVLLFSRGSRRFDPAVGDGRRPAAGRDR